MPTYRRVHFQARAISPSQMETPLQISCFFDFTKVQEVSGGMDSVDEHFHGAIRRLRENGYFRGQAFETLLIVPDNRIPARKLLFIGLGDPKDLNEEVLCTVGKIAVMEAVKLNVDSFSFAPSIQDAGVKAFIDKGVSGSIVDGMMNGVAIVQELAEQRLIPWPKLREINLLASLPHIESAQDGISEQASLRLSHYLY